MFTRLLISAVANLPWIAFEQRFYAQHACRDIYPRSNFIFRCFFRPQGKSDILLHGHVRIERIILEDHRHVAIAGPHVIDDIAADGDFAVGDLLKARDGPQQRALAAAGRPDQHREFAVGNVEIYSADRVHRAEMLLQPGDLYVCHFSCVSLATDGPQREATNEMLLHEHAQDDRGHERNDRKRARLAILRALEA